VSPRRTTSSASAGAVALTAIVVVAVAVALMFLVRARPSPGPYDPRSSSPDGLRGLALLLERYGATVRVGDGVPAPGADGRVLVVGDRLDDGQRAALNAFVAAGGVAVVADPDSPYQHTPAGDPGAPSLPSSAERHDVPRGDPTIFRSSVNRGVCTIAALEDLRGLAIERGRAFDVPAGATSCFGDRDRAVVRAVVSGAGTVVTIGDRALLTNRWLEYGDNAPLATALLAPDRGSTVTIVLGNGPRPAPTPEAGGDERLIDLVRPSVWMGLAQLAVAFVVLAIAVGVRPGRVVTEPVPSPLEGSSLVSATGNLMHRSGHAARAAQLLKYDVHRRLCERFGVPPSAPLSALDQELARRGLAAPGAIVDALSHDTTAASADLVALTDRLAPLSALADDPLGAVADRPYGATAAHRPPAATGPTTATRS